MIVIALIIGAVSGFYLHAILSAGSDEPLEINSRDRYNNLN